MHSPLNVKLNFCMIQATTKKNFFFFNFIDICIHIACPRNFYGLPNVAYTCLTILCVLYRWQCSLFLYNIMELNSCVVTVKSLNIAVQIAFVLGQVSISACLIILHSRPPPQLNTLMSSHIVQVLSLSIFGYLSDQ